MSIINDALQKIQRARYKRQGSLQYIGNNKPNKVLRNGIFLIAMFVLMICIYSYSQFSFLQNNAMGHRKLTLNGVFISDDTKLAMINNQQYHIGDKVGKMKVVDIDEEGVQLKHRGEVTELKVAA